MKLPVLGQGVGAGSVVSARHAVNVYFEPRPQGEKAGVVARALPKLTLRNQLIDCKGLWYMDDGFMYAYDDGALKRFYPLDTATIVELGKLSGASDWVMVAAGHLQTIVVGGINAYWTVENDGTLTVDTVPDVSPVAAVYHRGYYLVGGQNRLAWTPDPAAFDALDYASSDASRDSVTWMVDIGPAVAVFSERTIEFWAVGQNADSPFTPIVEATQRIGIANRNQGKKLGDSVYFWGVPETGTGGLYALSGMRHQRVSTPDIERLLLGETYDSIFGVVVNGFSILGHTFVHLHNRFSGATVLYDAAMGTWTEIPPGDPMSGQCYFASASAAVWMANATGVYTLDAETAEDGVQRRIVTDHVTTADFDRFTVNSARMDIGKCASLGLRVSRDGGETWGAQMTTPVDNAVVKRVQFNRLGTARQFTLELTAVGDFDLANIVLDGVN